MPVAGSEQDFVLDHEEAQQRVDDLGPRVVVLDAVGFIEAIGLGEMLARAGKQVTVVTALPTPIAIELKCTAHCAG